ncbi:MAG: 16S rRNA (guanine(527)-N(7))-methyltransferase RsmG [Ardenticatenaceae bacterium]|nr:16S rRNA (guanine(527)-N(7))-methyltransferase RsmG [Ardenticatenaceae bacterium]MCB8987017.1 16S rRNA (guanine(527)-N(7))-methyltransferase RsmG [Ardenticatenaceae bacterium]
MEKLAWIEQAAAWGLALTPAQEAQFERYLALLLDWNERLNLTAVRQPTAIQQRHFLDSLSCARVTGNLNGRALIDVGSGAGFPGLPLKILFPELRLTLVESVAKKTDFLLVVAAELGLDDVQVLVERAEVLGQMPEYRAQFDWAVARGVAEMRTLAEYLLPLVRLGGWMLAQKGAGAREETVVAAAAIRTLGGGEPEFTAVPLPDRDADHFLVVVPKVAATPAAYPRRPGVPGKRPL